MYSKSIHVYVYKREIRNAQKQVHSFMAMVPSLGCTLESPREIYKAPMPGSHPQRISFNCCGVQPRHWDF